MKAWLKGGLIGGGIALIIRIITLIFDGMFLWNVQKILMPFYYDSSAPFFGLVPFFGFGSRFLLQYLFATIVFVIYLSLIGAIIGWIVNKIKSKKQFPTPAMRDSSSHESINSN